MALINGTPDSDTLTGTSDDDQIHGEAGNDYIYGLGGNDYVVGGHGDDQVEGGAGSDELIGGGGNDTLWGGDGGDTLKGGAGHDSLWGDAGDDKIRGGSGYDFIVGGAGNDLLFGESGGDLMYGGTGADTLNGGEYNDTLHGDDGDDLLIGFTGRDNLFGGTGSDRLVGGAGRDELFGGDGADTLKGGVDADILYGDGGADKVFGQGGNDRALGGDGNDQLVGGDGEDRLLGENGDDVLRGSAGDDRAFGGGGEDVLQGGTGGDALYGGADADLLRGGDGADNLYGNAGNDTLRGEAGDDLIRAGVGDDVLLGMTGPDQLFGETGLDNLAGGEGNDQLFGGVDADILIGGSGSDALDGGAGGDNLFGGAGADRFIFSSATDTAPFGADRDTIKDFVTGEDRIDLSLIDAVAATGQNDAFTVVASFSGTAGELTISALAGGNLVAGDTDGDGNADFGIYVLGDAPVEDDLDLGAPAPILDLTLLRPNLGFVIQGDQQYDSTGSTVANAGDVNGDGVGDLLVEAYGAKTGGDAEPGEVFLIFGGAGSYGSPDANNRDTITIGSIGPDAGVVIRGGLGDGYTLTSTSSAGDINGDEIDDLIISASSGNSYVIFGTDEGFGETVSEDGVSRQVVDVTQLSASEGFMIEQGGPTVSSAGDVNNDGFDDLILGYANYQDGDISGSATVIFGTDEGFGQNDPTVENPDRMVLDALSLSPEEGFVIYGEDLIHHQFAGFTVSGAGDINADGFDDLIIGALMPDQAYVIYGSGNGFGAPGEDGRQTIDLTSLAPEAGFTVTGQSGAMGFSVESAGDFNGDGFADLIIGAPDAALISETETVYDIGEAFLVYGSENLDLSLEDGRDYLDLQNLTSDAGLVFRGASEEDSAGYQVSSAGDVNNDGLDDLLISAPGSDLGGNEAGAVYVIFGTPGGLGNLDEDGRQILDLGAITANDGFVIQGDGPDDTLARSVSSAGDLNDDGFDDIIVSAPSGDDNALGSGEAYVIYGRADFTGIYSGPNAAPVFVSGASVSAEEMQRDTGYVATASDADGHPMDYFISGGADASLFELENGSWSLTFLEPPDHESPADSNGDNVYEVEISTTDGQATVTQMVQVTVTEVAEAPVIDVATLSAGAGFVIQGDAAGDQAGYSVSAAGDINNDGFADIMVGARYGDDAGDFGGEAYILLGGDEGFGAPDSAGRQVVDLTTLSAGEGFVVQAPDEFYTLGDSVSHAGDLNDDGIDDFVIGGTGAAFGDGSAFVIFGSGDPFGQTVSGRQVVDLAALGPQDGFVIPGVANEEALGYSVSSAGDLNDDGIDDLVLGAPDADIATYAQGRAYVLYGSDSGFGDEASGQAVVDLTTLSASEGFIVHGRNYHDYLGTSVSAAGDFNGDGIGDLLIGAPDAETVYAEEGVAYLLFGTDQGFGSPDGEGRQTLSTYYLPEETGIQFVHNNGKGGESVAAAGDVNGDGRDDIVIGNWAASAGAGEAWVIFGTDEKIWQTTAGGEGIFDISFMEADEGFIIRGVAEMDRTGFSVSGAGDVNGDGLDDLLVGAINASNGADQSGDAYIVFGSDDGFGELDENGRQILDLSLLTANQGVIIRGGGEDDHLGQAVSAAGDINDDGFDDILVGAPYNDGAGTDAGEAYVIYGRADFTTGSGEPAPDAQLVQPAVSGGASTPPPEPPLANFSEAMDAALSSQMSEIVGRFGLGLGGEDAPFASWAPDGFDWF